VAFTDAILAQLEGDLCIDESRVFATGFSFGGGMAIALACTRADVFRAVAFFSGADLTGSCPSTVTKPIAYYASQASEDANGMSITNPMTGEMKQAQFAAVNGCTPEPTSTDVPAAGQPAPRATRPNTAFSTALTDGSRRIQVKRQAGMPRKPGSSRSRPKLPKPPGGADLIGVARLRCERHVRNECSRGRPGASAERVTAPPFQPRDLSAGGRDQRNTHDRRDERRPRQLHRLNSVRYRDRLLYDASRSHRPTFPFRPRRTPPVTADGRLLAAPC
jgi:pimeloyl-ACP methyl ester carboxylesterase